MSVLRKGESKRDALKVLLVTHSINGGDIKTALELMQEPLLDVTEGKPDPASLSNRNGNGNGNGAHGPDVVLVVFNGNDEEGLSYLQDLAELDHRPALFALLSERSQVMMKRVLRAGADELLFMPLDLEDAACALLKVSETRHREERHEGATIVSLVSLVGGVGVTTLCGNLALALRNVLERKVAIVDLDLQTSAMSVFLNLEPDGTIISLAGDDKKVDSIQLETALNKHSSGIYLLAAPKRIEDSELVTDATVATVLGLMRQLFDYVIVDCGTHVDAAKVAAWENSQHLFYVVDQSIGAARGVWRFIDLCGRLGLNSAEPAFILSRYAQNNQITEEQLSHTLAQPIYAKIPRDEKTLEKVNISAKDLWQVAPGSPIAKSYEAIARRLEGIQDSNSNHDGSIVKRLLGSFSARA